MRRKMLVILMPIPIPCLRSSQTCGLGDRLGSSSGAGFNEDDFPELTTSKFNSLRLRDDSPSGAGLVTNTCFLSSFSVQKKTNNIALHYGGLPRLRLRLSNLALLVPSKTSEIQKHRQVCCGRLRTPSTSQQHRIDLVTRSGRQERPPPTGLRLLTI